MKHSIMLSYAVIAFILLAACSVAVPAPIQKGIKIDIPYNVYQKPELCEWLLSNSRK